MRRRAVRFFVKLDFVLRCSLNGKAKPLAGCGLFSSLLAYAVHWNSARICHDVAAANLQTCRIAIEQHSAGLLLGWLALVASPAALKLVGPKTSALIKRILSS